MLRKLFKYDMKRVFRLWWIIAIAILAASVLIGLCGRVCVDFLHTVSGDNADGMSAARLIVQSLVIILGDLLFLGTVVAVAFLGLYAVFRAYKSLYSEEGALTFMLPVKRSRLLDEKALTVVCWQLINAVLFLLSCSLIIRIATLGKGDVLQELWTRFVEATGEAPREMVDAVPAFLAEYGALLICSTLFTTALQLLCLTVGAVIARKHKLLAGIGVYYGINSAIVLLVFVGALILGIAVGISESNTSTAVPEQTAVTGLLVFIAVLCAVQLVLTFVFRAITQHLVNKKLNLTN